MPSASDIVLWWQAVYMNVVMRLQQLSLGLVIPSLELTRWRSRQPHTSIPVVYTTLKMVVRRHTSTRHVAAADTDDADDDNVTSEWHSLNRRSHELLNNRCV